MADQKEGLNDELTEKISNICDEHEIDYDSFTQDILYLMDNDYQFLDLFSNNMFGIMIKSRSATYGEVAIKLINKSQISGEEFEYQTDIMESLKEAKYSVKFYEKLESDTTYFIVMELADCTLTQIVKDNQLTMSQIYALTQQLLLGIQEMSSFGVAHCDIKPDNILYSSKKNAFLYCNFDISKKLVGSLMSEDAEVGGTYQYIAPEIYNMENQLSYKVDLYSLGVVLSEILLKRKFTLQSGDAMKMRNGEFLKVVQITEENIDFCYHILRNMTKRDVEQRLEPDQLLSLLQNKFQFQENELKTLFQQ